jgi:hypothetical protein
MAGVAVDGTWVGASATGVAVGAGVAHATTNSRTDVHPIIWMNRLVRFMSPPWQSVFNHRCSRPAQLCLTNGGILRSDSSGLCASGANGGNSPWSLPSVFRLFLSLKVARSAVGLLLQKVKQIIQAGKASSLARMCALERGAPHPFTAATHWPQTQQVR